MIFEIVTLTDKVPDKGRSFFCGQSDRLEVISDLLEIGYDSLRDDVFISPDGRTEVYIWSVETIVHLEYIKGLF